MKFLRTETWSLTLKRVVILIMPFLHRHKCVGICDSSKEYIIRSIWWEKVDITEGKIGVVGWERV